MSTFKLRLRRGAAGLGAALLLATGLGALAAPAGAAAAIDEPTCPAAAGNARFVRYIYISILERCPDAGGLSYWVGQLNNGVPRSGFTNAIDMSTENLVNNNAIQAYDRWLRRAPSAAETAEAVAMIRATRGDATLTAKLISSAECFNSFEAEGESAKQTRWLADVYQLTLGREADEVGFIYFRAQLGTVSTPATRYNVAMQLEHSAENAQDWAGESIGYGLRREPDAGGIGYWSNWLLTSGNWQTFRMWTLILASNEGYAVAQTQPNRIMPS